MVYLSRVTGPGPYEESAVIPLELDAGQRVS